MGRVESKMKRNDKRENDSIERTGRHFGDDKAKTRREKTAPMAIRERIRDAEGGMKQIGVERKKEDTHLTTVARTTDRQCERDGK